MFEDDVPTSSLSFRAVMSSSRSMIMISLTPSLVVATVPPVRGWVMPPAAEFWTVNFVRLVSVDVRIGSSKLRISRSKLRLNLNSTSVGGVVSGTTIPAISAVLDETLITFRGS